MSDVRNGKPVVADDDDQNQLQSRSRRQMTNRRMFMRMLRGAVFRRRSRAVMAVVASLVGAATLFCLATICIAVPRQMNDEMRSYGANLVVIPNRQLADSDSGAGGGSGMGGMNDMKMGGATAGSQGSDAGMSNTDNPGSGQSNSSGSVQTGDSGVRDKASVPGGGFSDAAVKSLSAMVNEAGSAKSAAYRYENVQINSLPFVAAGVDPHDVKALNRHWSIEGKWPGDGGVMLGRDAATKLDVKIGSVITMKYRPGKAESVPASPHDSNGSNSSNGSDESGDKHSGMSGMSHGSGNTASGGMAGMSLDSSDGSGGDMSGMSHDSEKGMSRGMAGMKMSYIEPAGGHVSSAVMRYENPCVSPAEWHPTAPNAGGMEFRVAGIVDTGGSEDEIVYASNADVAKMTGFERGADVVEYSVNAPDAALGALANAINRRPSLAAKAQKVTRITASNVRIVTMLRTLLLIVTLVVLTLTLVGVGTTISSIVAQRQGEIALRKALGASSRDIALEFTVESAIYGLLGGLVGTVAGYLLARELSSSVFGQHLAVNWPLAVASVLLAALVAVVASLLPIHSAVRIDPAVVLREE